MALFSFGRKSEGAKEFFLGEIPLFSALTVSEQRLIEKTGRLIEVKRSDVVYHEGDPGDAFYVVISGRFRLFRKARSNFPEETLIFFYRGDHFGETSLLTNQSHSASVEAKSDGLVLKLEKPDFLKLVHDIPSISLHLSRSLGHRLTQTEDTRGHREVKTVALYSTCDEPTVLRFWLDLAERLIQETHRRTIVVDFTSAPEGPLREILGRHEIPCLELSAAEPNESDLKAAAITSAAGVQYLRVYRISDEEECERKIRSLVTFLTYRFNYLLLRMPGQIGHVTFRILNKSDIVYVHCGPSVPHLEDCAHALSEFQQGFGFAKSEIRVVVPEDGSAHPLSHEKKESVLGAPIFALIPERGSKPERYDAVIGYLAREMAGRLIGLALGSGAAHGLAHIGVLKVLEEEGIRPDVIAGASIGALIGALWAAGQSAADIEGIAKSINPKNGFRQLVGFRDLAFPTIGFLKGNQICRFLRPYLAGRTFQDLRVPLKIVATDFFTSEEVVLDSGDVLDAVRASIAIPGIFEPFYYRGRYLLDGGVIDPLPVRVLAQMGIKKIIAVNALQGPKQLKEINRMRREKARVWLESLKKKPFLQRVFLKTAYQATRRYESHIFNAIMNTIQFMEYEMAEGWGYQADVLIHPVLKEAHWAEFYSPDKFIRTGEARTREQIDEIRRMIAE
ncbi:MAG: patatin-like phospholipase family protein [Candidatus Omnitrophota bacterium]|jgi:NTE family protein